MFSRKHIITLVSLLALCWRPALGMNGREAITTFDEPALTMDFMWEQFSTIYEQATHIIDPDGHEGIFDAELNETWTKLFQIRGEVGGLLKEQQYIFEDTDIFELKQKLLVCSCTFRLLVKQKAISQYDVERIEERTRQFCDEFTVTFDETPGIMLKAAQNGKGAIVESVSVDSASFAEGQVVRPGLHILRIGDDEVHGMSLDDIRKRLQEPAEVTFQGQTTLETYKRLKGNVIGLECNHPVKERDDFHHFAKFIEGKLVDAIQPLAKATGMDELTALPQLAQVAEQIQKLFQEQTDDFSKKNSGIFALQKKLLAWSCKLRLLVARTRSGKGGILYSSITNSDLKKMRVKARHISSSVREVLDNRVTEE